MEFKRRHYDALSLLFVVLGWSLVATAVMIWHRGGETSVVLQNAVPGIISVGAGIIGHFKYRLRAR